MTREEAEKLTEWMYRCPYDVANGIEPVSVEEGRAVVGVTLQPKHKNIFGIPHGGLIFSIADVACGVAADTAYQDAHIVTACSNLNFLYAAPEAKSLRAVGQVIKAGRTLAVAQADVYDDLDNHLATGQFTMHVSYAEAARHAAGKGEN